jgi:MOSC domain-containing protein YiiM
VVSVNLGRIREIEWRGRSFRTGIDKRPAEGAREVEAQGFVEDVQGNRKVHGGVHKAVYAYASEHRTRWEALLGGPVPPGAFGENLTLEGVVEDEIVIGDRLRVGSALLEASEPRQPCSTLAAFHRRADLPRLFADEAWPGIYFRVLERGQIGAGDEVERIARGAGGWTLRRVFRLVMGQTPLPTDPSDLSGLLDHPALSPACRRDLERRARASHPEA